MTSDLRDTGLRLKCLTKRKRTRSKDQVPQLDVEAVRYRKASGCRSTCILFCNCSSFGWGLWLGSPLYTKIELYKRKPSVALQWPWLQGHGDDAIPSKIVSHHRYFQQKGVQNQSQKAYVVQGHSLDFPRAIRSTISWLPRIDFSCE